MSLYDSQNGSPLDIAKRNGCIRVAEMIEDAIRCKGNVLCETFSLTLFLCDVNYRFEYIFVRFLI